MKAKFIIAALSLFVAAVPGHTNTPSKETPKLPISSTSQIDLNKADLSSLIGSFKGIGKKRAEAIIAYRDSHHGFKSLEEFSEVKGLGQRFLTANREKLAKVFVIN